MTDNDGIAKQSVSINSAMMVCKREERIFFFYFVFLFIILELLQGLFVTWLQVQKHTGIHNPDANLKTHVQGKQMYVGLHHLVQILYYNQTLCVCVCVSVPKT
jgi:hypothetical protein